MEGPGMFKQRRPATQEDVKADKALKKAHAFAGDSPSVHTSGLEITPDRRATGDRSDEFLSSRSFCDCGVCRALVRSYPLDGLPGRAGPDQHQKPDTTCRNPHTGSASQRPASTFPAKSDPARNIRQSLQNDEENLERFIAAICQE
ncbi:hypothetical protein chiPu_0021514 [Chiloscyllium punctatum]|uniref:Uncharacterized protein n=1 Tax=Chiloscyllium punctatum TaxID=137246 RepID=A0A401RGL3_CHIPU|nr:hypothetical protein [Chiloscyllium punctatum]